jgi:hypothetical protein
MAKKRYLPCTTLRVQCIHVQDDDPYGGQWARWKEWNGANRYPTETRGEGPTIIYFSGHQGWSFRSKSSAEPRCPRCERAKST